MTNELKVFESEEFGKVRTLKEEDGTVLFCAKDVAKALGYSKPRNAVERHCRYALKRGVPHPQSPDKLLELTFVPEGDVFRLIACSTLPSAQKFERWVFDELLPTLRRTGGYITDSAKMAETYFSNFSGEQKTVITAMLDNILALQNTVKELEPKGEFYDAVVSSKDSLSLEDTSKVLAIKNLGRNNLFRFLREQNVLQANNRPYQQYINNGLFKCVEQKYTLPNGEVRLNIKPTVRQKGVDFIRRLAQRSGYSV